MFSLTRPDRIKPPQPQDDRSGGLLMSVYLDEHSHDIALLDDHVLDAIRS
jgi:hypothetical protein